MLCFRYRKPKKFLGGVRYASFTFGALVKEQQLKQKLNVKNCPASSAAFIVFYAQATKKNRRALTRMAFLLFRASVD